jgi:hypothetical protein
MQKKPVKVTVEYFHFVTNYYTLPISSNNQWYL